MATGTVQRPPLSFEVSNLGFGERFQDHHREGSSEARQTLDLAATIVDSSEARQTLDLAAIAVSSSEARQNSGLRSYSRQLFTTAAGTNSNCLAQTSLHRVD